MRVQPLRGKGGDAALMLYADGRSRDEVKQFLIDDALSTPARADKSLEFIEHPLWRTYVFCYAGGEQLLTDWCRAAGDPAAQRERFFRLLTEQLTPSGIAEEMAAASDAGPTAGALRGPPEAGFAQFAPISCSNARFDPLAASESTGILGGTRFRRPCLLR